jgi:carboxylesterase type B
MQTSSWSRPESAQNNFEDPNNPGLQHWPPYDLSRRATLDFDLVPKVIDEPRGQKRGLFSAIPYECIFRSSLNNAWGGKA